MKRQSAPRSGLPDRTCVAVLNQEKLFEFMPSRLTGFKSILRNLTIPKKHRRPASPEGEPEALLRRTRPGTKSVDGDGTEMGPCVWCDSFSWSAVGGAIRSSPAGGEWELYRDRLPAPDEGGETALSRREKQILDGLGRGESSAERGRALNISAHTVEAYYGRLIRKFGLTSMKELRKFALRRHG